MPIPYNPTSPQPGDLLSQSQSDLLTNFGSINTLISQDHVPFTGTNPGMHNQVSLVTQAGLPVFNPLGQVGMYSKTDATTGKDELYINKTIGGGTPAIVQIAATESVLSKYAAGSANLLPGTNGGTGWTMLPSGIKLVWGTAQTGGAGPNLGKATVNLALTPEQAFGTTLLSIQGSIISPLTDSSVIVVRFQTFPAGNINSFIAWTTSAGFTGTSLVQAQFMYLAIGY